VTSVTADTNVYISALTHAGPPLRLLNLGRAGVVHIDISDFIVTGIVRVLREKFEWDGYHLHFAKEQILKFGNRVAPTKALVHCERGQRPPETRRVPGNPDRHGSRTA